MMAITSALGAILILFGIALFIVDVSITNHGLLTAGASLCYSPEARRSSGRAFPTRASCSALVVVAKLMGGVLFGVLGSLRSLRGKPALTGKEGMIGEVGIVRSPLGVESTGWVFVHGERWRAVLALAPEETDPRDGEPPKNAGSKVRVVGFGEGGTVHVVSAERGYLSRSLDSKG
jgi:membrane-bound ClpP family serine protease